MILHVHFNVSLRHEPDPPCDAGPAVGEGPWRALAGGIFETRMEGRGGAPVEALANVRTRIMELLLEDYVLKEGDSLEVHLNVGKVKFPGRSGGATPTEMGGTSGNEG